MWKLLSSNTKDTQKTKSVIKRQRRMVRDVWNGNHYNDFGLERLLRLFLVVFAFTDIGLYLRNCFQGEGKGLHRKIFTDFYVIINLLFPCIVLFTGLSSTWIFWICVYLGIETLCALLSISFLTPNIPSSISYRRNLLSLFLNFLQFSLLFANFYIRYGVGSSDNNVMTPIKALYLSLETFTTVGFGDIIPSNTTGYVILVLQMVLSLVFISLFFAIFTSKLRDSTYFNKKS